MAISILGTILMYSNLCMAIMGSAFGTIMTFILVLYIAYYAYNIIRDLYYDKSGDVVEEIAVDEKEVDIQDELKDFTRFDANEDEKVVQARKEDEEAAPLREEATPVVQPLKEEYEGNTLKQDEKESMPLHSGKSHEDLSKESYSSAIEEHTASSFVPSPVNLDDAAEEDETKENGLTQPDRNNNYKEINEAESISEEASESESKRTDEELSSAESKEGNVKSEEANKMNESADNSISEKVSSEDSKPLDNKENTNPTANDNFKEETVDQEEETYKVNTSTTAEEDIRYRKMESALTEYFHRSNLSEEPSMNGGIEADEYDKMDLKKFLKLTIAYNDYKAA